MNEWHDNHYPRMIEDASNGEIKVVYAYGKRSSPITGKASEEWQRLSTYKKANAR